MRAAAPTAHREFVLAVPRRTRRPRGKRRQPADQPSGTSPAGRRPACADERNGEVDEHAPLGPAHAPQTWASQHEHRAERRHGQRGLDEVQRADRRRRLKLQRGSLLGHGHRREKSHPGDDSRRLNAGRPGGSFMSKPTAVSHPSAATMPTSTRAAVEWLTSRAPASAASPPTTAKPQTSRAVRLGCNCARSLTEAPPPIDLQARAVHQYSVHPCDLASGRGQVCPRRIARFFAAPHPALDGSAATAWWGAQSAMREEKGSSGGQNPLDREFDGRPSPGHRTTPCTKVLQIERGYLHHGTVTGYVSSGRGNPLNAAGETPRGRGRRGLRERTGASAPAGGLGGPFAGGLVMDAAAATLADYVSAFRRRKWLILAVPRSRWPRPSQSRPRTGQAVHRDCDRSRKSKSPDYVGRGISGR